MAKAKATEETAKAQKFLNDEWLPQVPKKVQASADEYVKKLRAKSKATAAFKAAEQNLIDDMKTAGLQRVRVYVDSGEKWVLAYSDDKVKTESIKPNDGSE